MCIGSGLGGEWSLAGSRLPAEAVDWTNAIVAQALALAGCSASAVGKVLGDEKLNWRWLFFCCGKF
jgi:predicted MFS family arabinose efflux permease